MTTLIVHPCDTTTDFLETVYRGFDFSVINSEISEDDLSKQITNHDRVFFLGHGTPLGLLGWGRLVFHNGLLNSLKNNPENIFVWCNADEFVLRNSLSGFYTGMFISEPLEALCYDLDTADEQIELSNRLFASTLHNAIKSGLSAGHVCKTVKKYYQSPDCPIIQFNSERLYFSATLKITHQIN